MNKILSDKKPYGEMKCPHCKKIFFNKKSLDCHIGGAHKKNSTKWETPHCKFCEEELREGKNWPKWAVKSGNLICAECKKKQNKESYYRNKERKMKEKEKKKREKEKNNEENEPKQPKFLKKIVKK